jgi:hypothetical protein
MVETEDLCASLKVEGKGFSERLVPMYQIALHYIPDSLTVIYAAVADKNIRICKNYKYFNVYFTRNS